MQHPTAILILPRIRVQNANAITSPFTWGFPGPPAFGGFVHALSRKLSKECMGVSLGAFAVLSHAFDAQAGGAYEQSFHLTRNPLKADGKLPSTIEEGRAHLTASLVICLHADGVLNRDAVAGVVARLMHGMRLAGGSIVPTAGRGGASYFPRPVIENLSKDADQAETDLRKILSHVRRGFALVSASGQLAAHHREMQITDPAASRLLALTDICALTKVLVPAVPADDSGNNGEPARRDILRRPGWLVPIQCGYRAISPLYPAGEIPGTRDPSVPHRFCESLLTLGQWISPRRARRLQDLLWHPAYDETEGLYHFTNPYPQNP